MNNIAVKTSKTMFLPNVCQFVSLIASPKQPQSDTGFVSASTRVRGVKNAIRIPAIRIPVFCLMPERTENPVRNSAMQRRIPSGRLSQSSHFSPNAMK